MATKVAALVFDNSGPMISTWLGITEADSGQAVIVPDLVTSLVIQGTGNYGAGGNITVEGSNDNTNFSVLKDITGTDIVLASTKAWQLRDNALYIRPRATAGTGVAVDVRLVGRRR